MNCFQLEILGFAAGATNLVSSVPQLIANIKNPSLAASQSPARNCLQCGANILWLGYGVQSGSVAMSTFATLGAAMAGILVLQTLRSDRAGKTPARVRTRFNERALQLRLVRSPVIV